MERKILNYWLMGLLAVSVAVGTASCKDDDDASQDSVEQRELDEAAQADRFWRVAGQLVGISQATDDYRSKTFEPTIGTPKDDDATVRIIATNDAETAAERFASLPTPRRRTAQAWPRSMSASARYRACASWST